LINSIKDGKVDEELIDDKVKRILTVAEFSKRFERPDSGQKKQLISHHIENY